MEKDLFKNVSPDFIKQLQEVGVWLSQNKHIPSSNHETLLEEQRIKDIHDFYDKLNSSTAEKLHNPGLKI